jgi:aryl-alcohol dehydrogenase-like predicted oxidoreductase
LIKFPFSNRHCGASIAWASSGAVPTRPLGKTGEQVSILGLGGWHLGGIQDHHEAISLVREAVDNGVTFLDNAWIYHGGRSEALMGHALRDGYRSRVFLMTKHWAPRDKKTAMGQLEDSLRRLQTDVIDLWQIHRVIYPDEPQRIFSPGGAIEAAEEAKKAGKVRYIGFTGHKNPQVFLKMLQYDYDWDTVQMPLNVLDPHFQSFQTLVLPILVQRNIGVIAMKTLAAGNLLQTRVVSPEVALTYVWSQPVATLVSGITSRQQLRSNYNLARSFTPMSQEIQKQVMEKTKSAGLQGKYEPYKTNTK